MKGSTLRIISGLALSLILILFTACQSSEDPAACENGLAPKSAYFFGYANDIATPEIFDKKLIITIRNDHDNKFWKTYWDSHYYTWLDKKMKPGNRRKASSNALTQEEKNNYRQKIDSTLRQFQVYGQELLFINNGSEDIVLQSTEERPICVKEAKDQSGAWKVIEVYNAPAKAKFEPVEIPAGKARSIFTTHRNEGDFQTAIRYKIVGTDQYLYSQSFAGKVNSCVLKGGNLSLPKSVLPN